MLQIRHADQRGIADLGWLQSKHSFSFGSYWNPQETGFSDLLVINDDTVAPGQGFGIHSHQDMEIISYVLDGALEHKDSLGTGSVITTGDVQTMSAGSGVLHSEFNHSHTATVHFLQIWILPSRKGIAPRYQQRSFPAAEKRGRLRLIVSPDATDGSLAICQDARIYAGLFDAAESAVLDLPPNRDAYIHVVRGSATVNGQVLAEGDGARLRDTSRVAISDGRDAEVLVFDLRPDDGPRD